MNNELKLSIIIPFYNVEKYIAECLDSVYNQDIPEGEYEVICVNDCSPDNSRDIVLEYQKKHSNLKLIEHESNKMLGAARNTGLRAAQGKYVWFIDSDDYIMENVFSRILDIANNDEIEILHFNIMRFDSVGKLNQYLFFPRNTGVITGISFLQDDTVPYWEKPVTGCSKLFLKSYLINSNFYFPEGVYFEDNVHTLITTLYCKKFKFLSDAMYFYRYNSSSIVNTSIYGGIKLGDKIKCFFENLDILYNYKIGNEIWFDVVKEIYFFRINDLKKIIITLSLKERKLFYSRLQNVEFAKYKDRIDNQLFYFLKRDFMMIYIKSSILKLKRFIKRHVKYIFCIALL